MGQPYNPDGIEPIDASEKIRKEEAEREAVPVPVPKPNKKLERKEERRAKAARNYMFFYKIFHERNKDGTWGDKVWWGNAKAQVVDKLLNAALSKFGGISLVFLIVIVVALLIFAR